jgi:hypothetical protein
MLEEVSVSQRIHDSVLQRLRHDSRSGVRERINKKYSGFIEHYSLPHKCVSMGLRPWALTTPLTKNKPNIRQSVFPNNQSKVQLFLQVDPVAKA